MQISLIEIQKKFDELINETIVRETVADWATKIIQAADAKQLEYVPPSEKDRILDSLIYLTNVDLLDKDNRYVHSIENFIDFWKEKNNRNIQVSLIEIQNKFDELINEVVPWEEISNWAIERQNAEDDGQLEYDPPSEEDRIWESISYLTGVDLKVSPNSYLHSIEDFIHFRKEMEF